MWDVRIKVMKRTVTTSALSSREGEATTPAVHGTVGPSRGAAASGWACAQGVACLRC